MTKFSMSDRQDKTSEKRENFSIFNTHLQQVVWMGFQKAISLHPPTPCVYSDLAGVIKVEGEVQGKGWGQVKGWGENGVEG